MDLFMYQRSILCYNDSNNNYSGLNNLTNNVNFINHNQTVILNFFVVKYLHCLKAL